MAKFKFGDRRTIPGILDFRDRYLKSEISYNISQKMHFIEQEKESHMEYFDIVDEQGNPTGQTGASRRTETIYFIGLRMSG